MNEKSPRPESTLVLGPEATAYMWNRGWAALVITNDRRITELRALQEKLREQKLYDLSDNLRKIISDLELNTNYVRSDLWTKEGTRRA